MMRAGRARKRFRGALPEQPLYPEPLGADTLEVELRRSRAGDDDEVDAYREQVRMGAKALTAEPLHPVSLHGAADPAAHDQAESRRSGHALRRQQEREMGSADAARVLVALRARELRVFAESSVGAEGHDARRRQATAVPAYFL
jgi:hypothetical protein